MAQGQGPCGGLEQRHPHSESAVPRSGVRIAAAGFGRLFGCRFLRSARDFADVIARGNHEDSSESLPKSGRPLIACWISCASADGRDAKEVRTEGPSRCGNPCVGSIAIRPTPSVLRTGCSRVLVRASGRDSHLSGRVGGWVLVPSSSALAPVSSRNGHMRVPVRVAVCRAKQSECFRPAGQPQLGPARWKTEALRGNPAQAGDYLFRLMT